MDPFGIDRSDSPHGLPRPRGDGPAFAFADQPGNMAPPPTRGWTRKPRGVVPMKAGSPAHAGMDPSPRRPAGRPRRLPRPRGDGPRGLRIPQSFHEAPPPTRGWTRDADHDWRRDGGSPAHAGMDPRNTRWSYSVRRLPPPTRGWTPREDRFPAKPGGSPAHAGMDPSASLRVRRGGWLPRPRGDGPSSTAPNSSTAAAPPPTRGWTLVPLVVVFDAVGSPAHAGMDPSKTGFRISHLGLPRPRGDGPAIGLAGLRIAEAPPPTRGWTRPVAPASPERAMSGADV